MTNDLTGDVGGDMKYGITANLTADFTVNTDFAQVEIDEQQVNLTRFSLFFPEKRDFFLEGRGIFDFARGGVTGAVFTTAISTSIQPYLFYSRRIGLNRGRVIPINGGGRLTGKVGKYAVGVMNIQTGDEAVSQTEPTNFTVVRVKRDILKRSSIGAMFTNRSTSVSTIPAIEPGLRRRRGVLVLPERRLRRVLRPHPTRPSVSGRRLTAIRRSPTTAAIATAGTWST